MVTAYLLALQNVDELELLLEGRQQLKLPDIHNKMNERSKGQQRVVARYNTGGIMLSSKAAKDTHDKPKTAGHCTKHRKKNSVTQPAPQHGQV